MHRLLVIEDNPADVEVIRVLLEDAGFKNELFSAGSLVEGFQLLQEKKIDIVLLDLTLRDSFGFSTLKNYIAEAPKTPVIVLTGNANVALGDQAVKAGAQDYLVKGEFDSKRLVDSVRYALQRFRQQSALQDKVSKLSNTETRFRKVQEMAQIGDWDMDIVTNSMTWSDETFRILGLTPFAIQPLLSDYLDRVHPEDRTTVEDFIDQTIKMGGGAAQMEHRLLLDNQVQKYIVLHARLNYEESANKILLLGNIQDVSHYKKQKEQSDQAGLKSLKVKESYLQELGFNLRLPLHTVIQHIHSLEKGKMSPIQKEIIHSIRVSIEELSLRINDFVVLAYEQNSQGSGTEQEILLTYMLQRTEDVLKFHTQNAGIKLKFKKQSDLPDVIRLDFPKFSQLLYNLLAAAIQYTSINSELNIQFNIKKSSEYKGIMQFIIEYQGISIWDPPVLDIDPPFERRNDFFLIAAERLIGPLNAQWTFLKKGPNLHHIELLMPVGIIIGHQKLSISIDRPVRILLVEDHSLYQMVIKNMLNHISDLITVVVAHNGKQALNSAGHRSFDLIIIDLHMPDMDGLEVGKELKKISPVPIVAMSAHPSRQEELECKNTGFQNYLPKPLNIESLGKVIFEAIQKDV